MKSKAIEKAEKRMSEILAEKDAELAGINSAINRTEEEKAKKEISADKAAAEGRFTECEKLKSEIAELEVKHAMYERRVKALKEEPLIEEAEYKELCDAVKEEANKNVEEAIKTLIENAEIMYEKSIEIEDLQYRVNFFLKKLCNKVFRSYKEYYDYMGRHNKLYRESESVDYGKLIAWSRRAVNCPTYTEYTGKEITNNPLKDSFFYK